MGELKIFSKDGKTIIELDGKTMGTGVNAVDFAHAEFGETRLVLSIDPSEFSFMSDGRFDEAVNAPKKPPSTSERSE